MILTYALDKKYNRYSKFTTLEEFNDNFNKAMYYYKDKFTKSEHIALKKLSKFAFSEKSPNTIGVAWSKGQSVVSATHKERRCENETFGISRSTFDRMLRKAKKLNLIRVINQKTRFGKKIHNVYAFNKFDELTPEKFEIVSKTTTIEESKTINESITILLELPRLKDKDNTYQQAENVDVDKNVDNQPKEVKAPVKEQEPKTDYQHMCKKIKGLFKEKDAPYRIYGIWLAHTKKLRERPSISLGLEALQILILEIKRRNALEIKPLDEPISYFNGIVKKLVTKWQKTQYEKAMEELHRLQDEINNQYLHTYTT